MYSRESLRSHHEPASSHISSTLQIYEQLFKDAYTRIASFRMDRPRLHGPSHGNQYPQIFNRQVTPTLTILEPHHITRRRIEANRRHSLSNPRRASSKLRHHLHFRTPMPSKANTIIYVLTIRTRLATTKLSKPLSTPYPVPPLSPTKSSSTPQPSTHPPQPPYPPN
jgi:hypothetical protein